MVGKQQDPPWADRRSWSLSYALLDHCGYPDLNDDEHSETKTDQIQQDSNIYEYKTIWYLFHKIVPNAMHVDGTCKAES